jgi:hypothetical protein
MDADGETHLPARSKAMQAGFLSQVAGLGPRPSESIVREVYAAGWRRM